MPKETFWNSATAVENDGVSEPVLTVTWGESEPGIYLNGVEFDHSGIDRLMTTLRRATGKDRTVTVTMKADVSDYRASIAEATEATKALSEELRTAGALSRELTGSAILPLD